MTDSSRLAELNTATQALAATTDFASTLRVALHLAAQLTRAESAQLVLFNKNTQQWFVHSTLVLPLRMKDKRPSRWLKLARPLGLRGSGTAPAGKRPGVVRCKWRGPPSPPRIA